MSHQFLPDEGFSHAKRAAKLLKEHPEVRKLLGHDIRIFCIALVVNAVQFLVAWLVKDQGVVAILVAAWFGAFPAITLYSTEHEFSHFAVFKSPLANRLGALATGLSRGIPTTGYFFRLHPYHHRRLGSYVYDQDVPSESECWIASRGVLGKIAWVSLLYLFAGLTRPARTLSKIGWVDRWIILNFVAQAAFNLGVVYFWGWGALLYLLMASWFSVGPHILSARVIQEHFYNQGAETSDYHGPLNIFLLGAGYHTAHHDLPHVPVLRLRQVYQIAPEFYRSVPVYSSYSKLILAFLLDPTWTLRKRVVR